jgi:hypothetical protein
MKSNTTLLAAFGVESNYSYADWSGAREYRDFPVRVSIPLPAGKCAGDQPVELRDQAGRIVPCHSDPFVKWPDGSVRMWELWFPLRMKRLERRRLELHRSAKPDRPVRVAHQALPSSFVLSARLGNGSKLRQRIAFEPPRGLRSETENPFVLGRNPAAPVFRGAIVRRAFGWYPGIELEIRVTNFAEADTTKVRGVRLEFALPVTGKVRYCVRQTTILAKDHPRLVESDRPFDVRADDHGIHVTDPAQLHEIEANYPQYERGPYLGAVDRWIGVADADAGWALVVPDAFERHPKAWRIRGGKVTVELHHEHAPPLQWRQGMTLFQRLHLVRLPARATAADFENEAQACLRPPLVQLDPELYRAAGWRIPFRYEPKRFPRTEFQFRDTFNFTWSRGTFDWGDATLQWGSPEQGMRRSGRNLEYDFVAVAAKEYARTGRAQLLKLLRSSAEHSMYTDFIAYSTDRWKNGGIAAHGPDHTWGSCYPSHIWAEGLTLYHQITGDRHALHVAKRVGDFLLQHVRERFPMDATFTIGVAIIGFDRVRPFHRDRDIRKFILALLDDMLANKRDEIGLFRYWQDGEQGIIPYVQAHLPEGLNIGYRLSGDECYLRAAFRLYQIHQGGGLLTVQPRNAAPECGYAAGHHITWMGCLASFAEKAWLDRMQYPEPE